jgi:hypothetical protein
LVVQDVGWCRDESGVAARGGELGNHDRWLAEGRDGKLGGIVEAKIEEVVPEHLRRSCKVDPEEAARTKGEAPSANEGATRVARGKS